MPCRACNQDHSPLIGCERAARMKAATQIQVATAINTPATNSIATNKSATNTLNRRKRADYNAYQREYMRKKRAQ